MASKSKKIKKEKKSKVMSKMAKAKKEVSGEEVAKPEVAAAGVAKEDTAVGRVVTYEMLNDAGQDVGVNYKGSPIGAARKYWRRVLREQDKKLDVVRVRERSRRGNERRIHVYKVTGTETVKIPDDPKIPAFRRGRTYTDPIFEVKPIEHMRCFDVRKRFHNPDTKRK
jgi:hypothetical protein